MKINMQDLMTYMDAAAELRVRYNRLRVFVRQYPEKLRSVRLGWSLFLYRDDVASFKVEMRRGADLSEWRRLKRSALVGWRTRREKKESL